MKWTLLSRRGLRSAMVKMRNRGQVATFNAVYVSQVTCEAGTPADVSPGTCAVGSAEEEETAAEVLMENKRKYLKWILISILGTVIVFLLYHSYEWKSLPYHSDEKSSPYHVAYPRDYKFIMDDTPTCKTSTPFLVLMVPVAPSNVAARDAIRQMWGNEKIVLGQLIKTLFVLGLPGGADAEQQQEKLRQESQQHHDLIQSNFLDSYYNLTIKTMVMLEWLAAHCTTASYAMKVDSDVLVHVENLVKLLLDPSTAKQNYMTGLVWWHSPVLRNPFAKFYMPGDVIAEPEYPPYPLGMAYIMSLDLPGKILSVSPQIRPIYIEDAYLGMCLKRLDISPTNPPENTMFLVNPTHPLSGCSLSKVIATTTTSIQQMTGYWKRSREPEARC